jgi:hypothetical protein
MTAALRELARRIDVFQDRFGRCVSWLMLLMVVVVFSDVIMRYAFSKSSVFTQELEWHLFGLVLAGLVASAACRSQNQRISWPDPTGDALRRSSAVRRGPPPCPANRSQTREMGELMHYRRAAAIHPQRTACYP